MRHSQNDMTGGGGPSSDECVIADRVYSHVSAAMPFHHSIEGDPGDERTRCMTTLTRTAPNSSSFGATRRISVDVGTFQFQLQIIQIFDELERELSREGEDDVAWLGRETESLRRAIFRRRVETLTQLARLDTDGR